RRDEQVLLPHRRRVERLRAGPLLDGLVLIAGAHQALASAAGCRARCTAARVPPSHSATASRSSGRRFRMLRTAALTARVTSGRVSLARNARIPKPRSATLAPDALVNTEATFQRTFSSGSRDQRSRRANVASGYDRRSWSPNVASGYDRRSWSPIA